MKKFSVKKQQCEGGGKVNFVQAQQSDVTNIDNTMQLHHSAIKAINCRYRTKVCQLPGIINGSCPISTSVGAIVLLLSK